MKWEPAPSWFTDAPGDLSRIPWSRWDAAAPRLAALARRHRLQAEDREADDGILLTLFECR